VGGLGLLALLFMPRREAAPVVISGTGARMANSDLKHHAVKAWGCHVKIHGTWYRCEFETEALLDLAIKAFEAQGYEVA
jgi:hypothetical protein